MKRLKQTLVAVLALIMCFAMSTSAFATVPNIVSLSSEETSDVLPDIVGEATYLVSNSGISLVSYTGDSEIMPLSSVSGYNQSGVSTTSFTLCIPCNGTGEGGMGITIQASCSYGDYPITYHGYAYTGTGTSVSGTMLTNQTIKKDQNLRQINLKEYRVEFECASGTPDYFVKVWIYG